MDGSPRDRLEADARRHSWSRSEEVLVDRKQNEDAQVEASFAAVQAEVVGNSAAVHTVAAAAVSVKADQSEGSQDVPSRQQP